MTPGEFYIDVICKSAGVVADDRLHSRGFTANIVKMNAEELMHAIEITENGEFAVAAFSEKNKGASDQIHREINRLVHNYLCAVASYADHSRNFMRQHYAGTSFEADYVAEVQQVFSDSELCRFVRDLRNFMTHRGLPESNFRLNFTRIKDEATQSDAHGGVPCEISSGVSYKTGRFLEWDGWTAPARRYLSGAGFEVALRVIFEKHIATMEAFESWFIDRFRQHHEADYAELEQLQHEFRRLEREQEQGLAPE